MFTPSNPIKATNPIVTACLAIGCRQITNVNLTSLERQIVSEYLVIYVRQITSNYLAIHESQITSNQNDVCPHHLAMLVTS
jgi:hypothetical protein